MSSADPSSELESLPSVVAVSWLLKSSKLRSPIPVTNVAPKSIFVLGVLVIDGRGGWMYVDLRFFNGGGRKSCLHEGVCRGQTPLQSVAALQLLRMHGLKPRALPKGLSPHLQGRSREGKLFFFSKARS